MSTPATEYDAGDAACATGTAVAKAASAVPAAVQASAVLTRTGDVRGIVISLVSLLHRSVDPLRSRIRAGRSTPGQGRGRSGGALPGRRRPSTMQQRQGTSLRSAGLRLMHRCSDPMHCADLRLCSCTWPSETAEDTRTTRGKHDGTNRTGPGSGPRAGGTAQDVVGVVSAGGPSEAHPAVAGRTSGHRPDHPLPLSQPASPLHRAAQDRRTPPHGAARPGRRPAPGPRPGRGGGRRTGPEITPPGRHCPGRCRPGGRHPGRRHPGRRRSGGGGARAPPHGHHPRRPRLPGRPRPRRRYRPRLERVRPPRPARAVRRSPPRPPRRAPRPPAGRWPARATCCGRPAPSSTCSRPMAMPSRPMATSGWRRRPP